MVSWPDDSGFRGYLASTCAEKKCYQRAIPSACTRANIFEGRRAGAPGLRKLAKQKTFSRVVAPEHGDTDQPVSCVIPGVTSFFGI